MKSRTKTGLEVLQTNGFAQVRGERLGLLAHPASVNGKLLHAVDILKGRPSVRLLKLFGPQHGLRGETQDNMIEWQDYKDPLTKIPVHSLYGKTRRPTGPMLSGLDTLVIDLQDVGSRYYTFIWTMFLCLQACAQYKKRVLVLDRPNPINADTREGPLLETAWTSFVGLKPLPVRHGLTIGEIARYLNKEYDLGADLTVIWMQNYKRRMWFDETGLPWVPPSPNMPLLETALVYPGMCLLEGTNLSEGRGTTRPFEIFGAPFIEPHRLVAELAARRLPGVLWRPLHFQPAFQKWAGQLCGGAQIHVTDKKIFRPVLTATTILATVARLHKRHFKWRRPPYEYERKKLPIDILAGSPAFRKSINAGKDPRALAQNWAKDLQKFSNRIKRYLRYE